MSLFAHRPTHASLGIASIMAGIFFLTVSDNLAKWLGAIYSPMQLLFLRGAFASAALVIVLGCAGGMAALRTQHLGIHALRGILNAVAAYCFYLSLTLMPLAATTAIAFSAPLLVTVLSVCFLKEKVRLGGWLALLAGFGGVLLIARPSPTQIQWVAALPMIAALGYALMMISARRITAQESMLTTMLYIALGQAVFSAPLVVWVWEPIQAAHLPGVLGIALFSTLGLGLITQAFRIAPASVVAPFDYSGLIWATLFGWLIWNEKPALWFYLGALLIAGSGIYVALFRRPPGTPS